MTLQVHGPDLSLAPVIDWKSRLDGVTYAFRLAYRERFDCWDIRISTNTGEIVIDGMRVTEGIDMLEPFVDRRLPPGKLICVDRKGEGAHPRRNDWRERHILTYEPFVEEEVDNELYSSPHVEEMPE